MTNNEKNAKILCDAIKKMVNNENAINNFQSYLEFHFDKWMQKYAYDPDGLTTEFKNFSETEV